MMRKVKIIGLPKFVGGGTPPMCAIGYTMDPEDNSKCITQQEALNKMLKRSGNGFQNNVGPTTTTTLDPNASSSSLLNLSPTTTLPATDSTTTLNPNNPSAWSKITKTADLLASSLGIGNALTEEFFNKPDRQRAFESQQRNNMFTQGMKATNRGMGAVPNTGKLVPQLGGQGQSFAGMMGKYGGEFKQTRKVIIEEVPSYMKMAYGGQTKHSLDITRQAELRSRSSLSEGEQFNKNLSEKKGEDFVLEGEKDELLWKPADYELYKFGGKFHSQGGTKLTAAQAYGVNSDIPSFIFSRVLKVPAKVANQEFGLDLKKGISPADIASKYLNLNKWNAILKDPNSTSDEKKSAQMSIAEISRSLAKLAVIHEEIKGKQAPDFAQQMLGMGEQQNQQMPPNQEMAKWGGNFSRKLPSFEDRLLVDKTTIPINTNVTVTTPFSQDYADFESYFNDPQNDALVNELYNRYVKDKAIDPSTLTKDQYKNILLTAQKQIWALRSKYDKGYLDKIEWDKGATPNTIYEQEMRNLGLDPMSQDDIKQFQNIYRHFSDVLKDPQFAKTYGDIFEIDPEGVADQTYNGQPISQAEGWFGNTTSRQWTKVKKKSQAPVNIGPGGGDQGGKTNLDIMYVCLPVGGKKGQYEVKEVPASVGVGYKTKEEAQANCGKGFTPPLDFTTPAKMKMTASLLGFPTWDPGVFPNMSAVKRNTMLPVWDAAAQAAFATGFKAPAEMLAAYAAPQGLGSNYSSLAGQAADLIGAKIIPQIEQQRVGIYNEGQQDLANELRRVQQFNIGQQEKRAAALATANDKYADEVPKWLMNVADVYDQAWTQRSDIDATNALTNYYIDPRTGRYKFKPGYRNIFGANYSYPGSDAASSTASADLLKKNYESMTYIKDDELRLKAATQLTLGQMKGVDNDDDDWKKPGKSKNK